MNLDKNHLPKENKIKLEYDSAFLLHNFQCDIHHCDSGIVSKLQLTYVRTYKQ